MDSGDPADCVFCAIVAGTVPCAKVAEDELTFAFMDVDPGTDGHLLVIPKRHSADLLDVDADDLTAIVLAAQRISRAVVSELGADGVNLLNCSGKAAWQTVFHVHLHVIPRYDDRSRDRMELPFEPGMPADAAAIAQHARLLAAALIPEKNASGKEFVDADLSAARFVRSNLARAVMRGVDVAGLDVDAPWLLDGESSLRVNGVDVAPLVDAELDRRFPGRALRRAEDPDGLRAAWAAVERAWDTTLERAQALPENSVDIQIDGEWSFAQTLRHLVMAIDTWLGRAVLRQGREAYHPIGQPHIEFEADGGDMSIFSLTEPTFAEVLTVRADRVAMVRDFLEQVTPEVLMAERVNPWAPGHSETVLACLHTILEEEWEHHRYAVRDLEAVQGLAPDASVR